MHSADEAIPFGKSSSGIQLDMAEVGGRLPSQFLLVPGVWVQGRVDEELIEDVPLQENKQNKREPRSKTSSWQLLFFTAVGCVLLR